MLCSTYSLRWTTTVPQLYLQTLYHHHCIGSPCSTFILCCFFQSDWHLCTHSLHGIHSQYPWWIICVPTTSVPTSFPVYNPAAQHPCIRSLHGMHNLLCLLCTHSLKPPLYLSASEASSLAAIQCFIPLSSFNYSLPDTYLLLPLLRDLMVAS